MMLLHSAAQEQASQLQNIASRAAIEMGDAAAEHLEVIRFLARPASYAHHPATVEIVESHMSLVFLAGDLVFKIKRPVHLKFVDFRTLSSRRHYCETELAVNQRLAPGIYLAVAPLVRKADGALALDAAGEPVDYVVVMRRLDQEQSFEARVRRREVSSADVDDLCRVLAAFYREQPPVAITGAEMIGKWQTGVERMRQSLTDAQFGLETRLTGPPLAAIQQFLDENSDLIAQRVAHGWVRDGHGDLKPEHVYPGPPVLFIDRLEIDAQRRWCDPFDEIAFLGMECTKMGAGWIADRLTDALAGELGDRPPPVLLRFYSCYRACLRARFAIEHLLDEAPRTPQRWPRRAREYLALAAAEWEKPTG
ncbi:hypothetical protein GRI44_00305 [Altererythrobacter confluentis]|uniref:Aminoglycoside phosphotransferase domain-containing protein n=1 Tax=Allopontixanthobacter confluentis TaxID=1849021 RepID=A0A6L7GEY9_9SPHN|nr:hypothetical protein [Allopontixanthobacter confluentis]MXP13211.1 hypothetical protein [Allopontixanthobacter confluentis]